MIHNLKYFICAAVLCLGMTACSDDDDNGNAAVPEVTFAFTQTESVLRIPDDGEPESPVLVDFAQAYYIGGTEGSYDLELVEATDLVASMLEQGDSWLGDAEPLPQNLYTMPSTITLKRGETLGMPIVVDYDAAVALDKTKTYVLAVRLQDATGTVNFREGKDLCIMKITSEMFTPPPYHPEMNPVVSYDFATGTNIALGASIEVSSVLKAYTGDKLIDGIKDSNTSRWLNAKGNFPAWAIVTFAEKHTIKAINIVEATTASPRAEIKDAVLEYWDGFSWVEIVTITDNSLDQLGITFTPVQTTQVRLTVTKSYDNNVYCRLGEMEILE